MSPQPDVVLDVQKYIGTCLISQKPRGRKNSRAKEKAAGAGSGSNHFRKNVSVGPPTLAASQQLPPPTPTYAICKCCGNFTLGFGATGPPQPTSPVNLQWAGYPLISLAAHKKNMGKSMGHTSKSIAIPGRSGSSQSETDQSLECNVSPPGWDDLDPVPLSTLAFQGAPLILANNVNYKKYKPNFGYGVKASPLARGFAKDPKAVEGLELADSVPSQDGFHCSGSPVASLSNPATLDTFRNDPDSDLARSSPSTSDCMSITSEESSGLSECSLPRILKPRKRRKRDRRLSRTEDGSGCSPKSNGYSKTLVTLKPYRPLCYHFNEMTLQDDGDGSLAVGTSSENCFVGAVADVSSVKSDMDGDEDGNDDDDIDDDYPQYPIVAAGFQRKYPYPPSPLCRCVVCLSPALLTPPVSPLSSLSSPSTSSVSASSSSVSSSPPVSVTPPLFPTPPLSPSLSPFPEVTEPWPNIACQVDTRIVTACDGSKDLEIKFVSLNGDALGKQSAPLDNFARPATGDLTAFDPDSSVVVVAPPASSLTATQPPSRPWITLAHPNRTHPTCVFTVMCYNVLCDKYATRQMYGYCPNWALNWEYRRKGIMDEIRHYMADIISLQEVETEQFYNMFLPELKKDGYDGIFSPKSRAKTMGESERKYVDGCAIFFRTSKFRLIKEHLVEFTQLAMANAEGSDDMLNRVMTKDNIGLAALLETREGAWEHKGLHMDPSHIHQPLLVCTAHIHWDPEYCDVKLIQTMMLMNELRNIVEESSRSFRPGSHKPDCNAIPLILCGDFNSLPESGVIEFLTSGRISSNHPDLKELGYKACLQKLCASEKPNEYTHSFKIARAYSNEHMPFTNYTFDFKGIIDYVLFSEAHMVPLGLLGPVDPEWLRTHKVIGCPHPHIPSDHFPLLLEFEMPPHPPTMTNGLVLRR